MTHPTETPPPVGPAEITDAAAPDFLEAHRVALLAFLDLDDALSQKMHARLALLLARYARPDGGLGVGVVDVSRHRLVAEALGVTSAPTVIVFVDGEVVDRLMGAPPETILDATLRTRLG